MNGVFHRSFSQAPYIAPSWSPHGASDLGTSPMENLAILEMNDWETILVVFKLKNHLGTQQSWKQNI